MQHCVQLEKSSSWHVAAYISPRSPCLLSTCLGSNFKSVIFKLNMQIWALTRSRPKMNYWAGRDFGAGPEFGATQKQLIILGNSRAGSCAGEVDRVTWLFGLANSTYFFKITNHNQHAFNSKYSANLIKKYWTCFRYQKLADFLVCFLPSVRMQVRWPPSWKICLRIQL